MPTSDEGRQLRVLLLSLYFAPDVGANATIVTALAEELAALGHAVRVVAAFPHYAENAIAAPYRGKLAARAEHGPIEVWRTALYLPRDKRDVGGRLLSYLTFHALSTLVGALAGGYDVVLAPSPPLTIGLSAWLLARLRGAPYVYNVQDIYPDVAVQLGVLTDPRTIVAFRRVERFVYRHAAAVTVLSEGFRRNLLGKGVPAHKIHVIPNFVDTAAVRPLPKANAFARRNGLESAFVALYAGNVGLSQHLEGVLAAARQLADLPDLCLLVVGNGAAKLGLEARAADMGLRNVAFMPFQPQADVPQIYAAADVCLVPLKRGIGAQSVPSKAYTVMAAGRPIIAAVDADSETRRLVGEAGCGVWVPPEDPAALAEAIRALHGDPARRAEMGRRGRDYVMAHHTPQAAARQYDALLRSLVGLW